MFILATYTINAKPLLNIFVLIVRPNLLDQPLSKTDIIKHPLVKKTRDIELILEKIFIKGQYSKKLL